MRDPRLTDDDAAPSEAQEPIAALNAAWLVGRGHAAYCRRRARMFGATNHEGE